MTAPRKITKNDMDVYSMLVKEHMQPYQIAKRRGISQQAVHKVVKKLRDIGYINKLNQPINQNPMHPPMPPKKKLTYASHGIRLHAQEWNIKILKKGTYDKIRSKANTITIDNNTVRLYGDSMEIYSHKDFWGDTASDATNNAMEYWVRFFHKLEYNLGCTIMKDRYQNIKLVKHHYAEVNNELAKNCNENKKKIIVKGTHDGLVWFHIDDSLSLSEAETTHLQTAKQDMENVVVPFFNYLRDNPEFSMEKLSHYIDRMAQENLKTAQGLNNIVKLMNMQTPQEDVSIKDKPYYVG